MHEDGAELRTNDTARVGSGTGGDARGAGRLSEQQVVQRPSVGPATFAPRPYLYPLVHLSLLVHLDQDATTAGSSEPNRLGSHVSGNERSLDDDG